MLKVKPIAESLDFISQNQCSVARFGDGEMDIIVGHNIPYQDYDAKLATQLREIMGQEVSEDFLVCLPDVFDGLERYNHQFSLFWSNHLERFGHLYEEICQSFWYGSAFISRPYMDLEDKSPVAGYFSQLKRLWQDKDILIVEGETSRSGVGNDLFASAKSICRIICPSKNAYAYYDEIAQAIRQHGRDKLVLLMLGPTAKVLSYHLSKEGFWTVDLGHIDSEYEWFLMGAKQKIKLGHKHTAEHNYDEGIELMVDEEYQKQIVAKVLQPLISVIVPVHNVEMYLEECLRSITEQSYRELEILIVDDGSTDGSPAIYEQFAQEDSRFTIIRQENSGQSSARNTGLSWAKADLVTFVDSDDVLHTEFIQVLHNQLQLTNADIAVSNYYQYREDDGKFYVHNFEDKSSVEIVDSETCLFYQSDRVQHVGMSFITIWGKLYRKSLFDQVQFPVGQLIDDEYMTHKLFLMAEKIVFINQDYYLYRIRQNSVMTDPELQLRRIEDGILAFETKLVDMAFARMDNRWMLGRFAYFLQSYKWQLENLGMTDKAIYREACQRLQWFDVYKESEYLDESKS